MLFAMGGKALYALSRVALPPLTLHFVGLSEYGLWAACFVIVSYMGMTASGFALVYLRRTSQHMAVGDVAAVSRLLSTGMFTMATLAAALLVLLWAALPALLSLFHVPAEQQPLARQLWLGACAVFLADMSLGAFGNVLHAVNRVRQEQTVWIASYLVETLCIVAFLLAGWGIHSLLAAFAVRYVLACAANGLLVFKALPGLVISPRLFDNGLLRHFFGAGSVMRPTRSSPARCSARRPQRCLTWRPSCPSRPPPRRPVPAVWPWGRPRGPTPRATVPRSSRFLPRPRA
jgi:O-antigen/teichoic acid export membrane protein